MRFLGIPHPLLGNAHTNISAFFHYILLRGQGFLLPSVSLLRQSRSPGLCKHLDCRIALSTRKDAWALGLTFSMVLGTKTHWSQIVVSGFKFLHFFPNVVTCVVLPPCLQSKSDPYFLYKHTAKFFCLTVSPCGIFVFPLGENVPWNSGEGAKLK